MIKNDVSKRKKFKDKVWIYLANRYLKNVLTYGES